MIQCPAAPSSLRRSRKHCACPSHRLPLLGSEGENWWQQHHGQNWIKKPVKGCLALRAVHDPLCSYFGEPASCSIACWSLLSTHHGYSDYLCLGPISLLQPFWESQFSDSLLQGMSPWAYSYGVIRGQILSPWDIQRSIYHGFPDGDFSTTNSHRVLESRVGLQPPFLPWDQPWAADTHRLCFSPEVTRVMPVCTKEFAVL